jgi:hypothetical protein
MCELRLSFRNAQSGRSEDEMGSRCRPSDTRVAWHQDARSRVPARSSRQDYPGCLECVACRGEPARQCGMCRFLSSIAVSLLHSQLGSEASWLSAGSLISKPEVALPRWRSRHFRMHRAILQRPMACRLLLGHLLGGADLTNILPTPSVYQALVSEYVLLSCSWKNPQYAK